MGRRCGRVRGYMELLKLLTCPGVSPGVGWLRHGFSMLQIIPWSHGTIPADGMALLGK